MNRLIVLFLGISFLFLSCIKDLEVNDVYYANGNNHNEPPFTCGSTVTDGSGNVYNTVQIGTQCWLKENLRTIKYNDGSIINYLSENLQWSLTTSGAYCYYNTDINNSTSYGALYNWYAVNTGKLCPVGWRVPTGSTWTNANEDWNKLANFLGSSTCGGQLKQTGTTYWYSPNSGATNSSNFSARGGGFRFKNGTFIYLKEKGYFWTSSSYNSFYAYNRGFNYDGTDIYKWGYFEYDYAFDKQVGLSVRCVKN